jgi:hypothetical protein
MLIETRWGSGGQCFQDGAGHWAENYILDAGLAIVGFSGAQGETPGSAATAGFKNAIQIGGIAGAWMNDQSDTRSILETGIDIQDHEDIGIYIHDMNSGGDGHALIIDSDGGDVGIGTTSLSEVFEVYGGQMPT